MSIARRESEQTVKRTAQQEYNPAAATPFVALRILGLSGLVIGALNALTGCATSVPASRISRTRVSQASNVRQAAPETVVQTAIGKPIVAPPRKPVSALKLPVYHHFKLRNGLSVLLVSDSSVPLIDVSLVLRVGSIDDPVGREGLAQFTAEMLQHGVKGMTAEQIAQQVDAAGASLRSSAGYEMSTISCGGRARVLSLCLSTVARLATTPTFPEKEIPLVRKQLLGAIKGRADNPPQLAALHFANMLYGDDHPKGRPTSSSSIQAISRRDLRTFHRKHFRPGSTTPSMSAMLVVSGATNVRTLKRHAQRYFGRWRGRRTPRATPPPLNRPEPGLTVLLVDKPNVSQSSIVLGHAGVPRFSPTEHALALANYTLGGGGFSSRLMKRIRAAGGKTYGVRSQFSKNEHDGSFSVATTTRNGELVETLKLIQTELLTFLSSPPSAAEIAAAKGKLAGGYVLGFESPADFASALAMTQIRGQPIRRVTDLPLQIQAVSAAQIAATAKTHVRPNQLFAAIVGKAKVVAPLLKSAGVRFTQIHYLEPVSARSRKQAHRLPSIDKEDADAANTIVMQAIAAMGGEKRLTSIRNAVVRGTMSRANMTIAYVAMMHPPDRLRLEFRLTAAGPGIKVPPMTMVQLLAGNTALAIAGGKRQPLPPEQVTALRRALWRQPWFILQNLNKRGVMLRRAVTHKIYRHEAAIDAIIPHTGQQLTLTFDRKTNRLQRVYYRTVAGGRRVTGFSDYRKVRGIWLPFSIATGIVGAKQTHQRLSIEKIELNTRLAQNLFALGKPRSNTDKK